jgi:hypothetical protein
MINLDVSLNYRLYLFDQSLKLQLPGTAPEVSLFAEPFKKVPGDLIRYSKFTSVPQAQVFFHEPGR